MQKTKKKAKLLCQTNFDLMHQYISFKMFFHVHNFRYGISIQLFKYKVFDQLIGFKKIFVPHTNFWKEMHPDRKRLDK